MKGYPLDRLSKGNINGAIKGVRGRIKTNRVRKREREKEKEKERREGRKREGERMKGDRDIAELQKHAEIMPALHSYFLFSHSTLPLTYFSYLSF